MMQKGRKTGKRTLGAMAAVSVLLAMAANAPGALALNPIGILLPSSIADPDGDGTNIFGLSGLSGLATNVLFNSGMRGGLNMAEDFIRGGWQATVPRPRPSFHSSQRSFTNKLRAENNARIAEIEERKRAVQALEELFAIQAECEITFQDVCTGASFPVASLEQIEMSGGESQCECSPAIALAITFDDPALGTMAAPFDEQTFREALAAELGVDALRVRLRAIGSGARTLSFSSPGEEGAPAQDYVFEDATQPAPGEGLTVDVMILPDLRSYRAQKQENENKVRAQAVHTPLFQQPLLASLEALLSSQTLGGYGTFSFAVDVPDGVCQYNAITYPALCQQ
mmetsp:Transcript_10740/g.22250  ORF Transcript_10740/g.22250 Transcript_10740/m.22250 type:complete len:340 (-) Transcript_10740:35-1054(-)